METKQKEMPLYQSHMKVRALKIKKVITDIELVKFGEGLLVPEDNSFTDIRVDWEYMDKYNPISGGYYVRDEYGCESWSPALVFEKGNTLVGMSKTEKLEVIVRLFSQAMFHGSWKWETPNERTIEMLMREVGYYPFKDEDDMISKTTVDEELYKRAIKVIPTRSSKNNETKSGKSG